MLLWAPRGAAWAVRSPGDGGRHPAVSAGRFRPAHSGGAGTRPRPPPPVPRGLHVCAFRKGRRRLAGCPIGRVFNAHRLVSVLLSLVHRKLRRHYSLLPVCEAGPAQAEALRGPRGRVSLRGSAGAPAASVQQERTPERFPPRSWSAPACFSENSRPCCPRPGPGPAVPGFVIFPRAAVHPGSVTRRIPGLARPGGHAAARGTGSAPPQQATTGGPVCEVAFCRSLGRGDRSGVERPGTWQMPPATAPSSLKAHGVWRFTSHFHFEKLWPVVPHTRARVGSLRTLQFSL